jgi:hypothetical protein
MTAKHTATTAPLVAARDRRWSPHVIMGVACEQFRTGTSVSAVMVQCATLARTLLEIEQPESLRNSSRKGAPTMV